MDWLMRKVMVKPPEYTQWPPALRLFYRFLSEKGYLDDPEPMHRQACMRLNPHSSRW